MNDPNYVPGHSKWRHRRAHAAIGRSTGLPDESIILAEDGTWSISQIGSPTPPGALRSARDQRPRISDNPAALAPITAEVIENAVVSGTRDAEALQQIVRGTVGR